MEISIASNIREVSRTLTAVQKKQIPYAASQTINQLVYQISREVMPQEAQQTFQGGATAFTRRGFKYQKSNKRNLTGEVFVDKAQAKYLRFQVDGGTRFPDRKALIVPTKHSKLNRYGNMRRGTLQKMLNDKGKYFKGKPKGAQNATEGIWERYGRKTSQRIRMVAQYKRMAQYRPLFPFGEIGEDVVFSRYDGFARKFRSNLERALRNAR